MATRDHFLHIVIPDPHETVERHSGARAVTERIAEGRTGHWNEGQSDVPGIAAYRRAFGPQAVVMPITTQCGGHRQIAYLQIEKRIRHFGDDAWCVRGPVEQQLSWNDPSRSQGNGDETIAAAWRRMLVDVLGSGVVELYDVIYGDEFYGTSHHGTGFSKMPWVTEYYRNYHYDVRRQGSADDTILNRTEDVMRASWRAHRRLRVLTATGCGVELVTSSKIG